MAEVADEAPPMTTPAAEAEEEVEVEEEEDAAVEAADDVDDALVEELLATIADWVTPSQERLYSGVVDRLVPVTPKSAASLGSYWVYYGNERVNKGPTGHRRVVRGLTQ